VLTICCARVSTIALPLAAGEEGLTPLEPTASIHIQRRLRPETSSRPSSLSLLISVPAPQLIPLVWCLTMRWQR